MELIKIKEFEELEAQESRPLRFKTIATVDGKLVVIEE